MKKALIALSFLLLASGAGLMTAGMMLQRPSMGDGVPELTKRAAALCEPAGKLRVTKTTRVASRTRWDFYCDDAQGGSRNLIDEMSEADPTRRYSHLVLAGVGVSLLGLTIAILVARRQQKKK